MKDVAYILSPALWAERALGFQADRQQSEILDSSSRRIIVNCHRQWGKSTISAILCLHRAIFWPRSLCLIVAPALRQSSENFRKVLSFMDRLEQPPAMAEDTKLSCQLSNESRVICLPGGSDGKTVRGFSGPDLIVEDEAARCSDELHLALMPMLASNPHGRVILSSTPFGRRGHFYELWAKAEGWQRVELRASQNPRISSAYLAEMRATLGEWQYRQEFECQFVSTEDQYFSSYTIDKMFDTNIKPLWGDSI